MIIIIIPFAQRETAIPESVIPRGDGVNIEPTEVLGVIPESGKLISLKEGVAFYPRYNQCQHLFGRIRKAVLGGWVV